MAELAAGGALIADDALALFELAGWSADGLGTLLAAAGLPLPARPGGSAAAGANLVLRIGPRLAWVLGEPGTVAPAAPIDAGVVVALGNSRLRFRLRQEAASRLPRLVGTDIAGLAPGGFVLTPLHGVPVAILAVAGGYDVLVPRSFAASLADWIAMAGDG